MDEQNKLAPRERFLKIYANLPSQAREETIYITEDENKRPYTWNSAYTEIISNSSLSQSILSYLERLGLI